MGRLSVRRSGPPPPYRAYVHFAFMAVVEFALFSTGKVNAMLAGIPWLLCLALVFVVVLPFVSPDDAPQQVRSKMDALKRMGQLPQWPVLLVPPCAALAYGYAGFVQPGPIWIAAIGTGLTADSLLRKIIAWKAAT